ncbi:MAG: methyltransferase family protein [Bacteroidota bacterium]
MTIASLESAVLWAGALLAYTTLGVLLYGIWRGLQREAGRTTGQGAALVRSVWFYLFSSALFFGVCYLAWKPVPVTISPGRRLWTLAAGSLLYFPGIGLTLWGRLALGKDYFVSTGFGAQLLAGQRLVTQGPFAIVRHPMYCGLVLGAVGSLLLYLTWTTVLLACFAPFIFIRAWREEQALRQEFGDEWREYRNRVPAFFPLRKRQRRS